MTIARATSFALLSLVTWQAASACEGLDGKMDPSELGTRAPILGEPVHRKFVMLPRRVMRADRAWTRNHAGVQYTVPLGTAVVAIHGGRVEAAQTYGGYGNAIVIDHGAGSKTLYAQLGSFEVREGDCVAAGNIIGRVGPPGELVRPSVGSTSGFAGPALHFEVSADGRFGLDLAARAP